MTQQNPGADPTEPTNSKNSTRSQIGVLIVIAVGLLLLFPFCRRMANQISASQSAPIAPPR
jgi:hypothetical protein